MDNLWARAARYMSIEENEEARKRKSLPHTMSGGTQFMKRSRARGSSLTPP